MCIFCDIVSGKAPSRKVYEDEQVVAFKDIYPQSPVHILIVPKKHIASIVEISDEDGPLLVGIVTAAKKIAEQQGVAKRGFRLVANNGPDGGQTVNHLHFHLLAGDVMGRMC